MTSDIMNTLVEDDSRDGSSSDTDLQGWLIAIGSPEDGFATAGRIVKIRPEQSITFGREDDADSLVVREGDRRLEIGIPFGWASGQHAELTVSSDHGVLRCSIRDLGSRNGTLVNGLRIDEPIRLRSGEVFEIGRSFWTVRGIGRGTQQPTRAAELDPTGTCSPHLLHIHKTLHRLAPSKVPILLVGETGTGKEYLARAIHRVSGRSGPFVIANLSAMSENRVESLLFGQQGKPGLLSEARGGTLMLDELSELSPSVQSKLRSALTDGQVGDGASDELDVRLIATSLRALGPMVESGQFRPDLYSRLNGFVAELPPLRARREDMGLLCRGLVQALQREGRPTRLTANAFRRVLSRAWPFNVRQLRQATNTAALLASGDGTITADALAEYLDRDDGLPHSPDELRILRTELLRELVRHQGDVDKVALAMGRDAYQIKTWLERFAVDPAGYR